MQKKVILLMSGENEMERTSLNNANAPSQIELISRQCTKGEFSSAP